MPKESIILENVPIRFSVPTPTLITESKHGKKVRGIALKATTSRNGVTYVIDEMHKAAPSLVGRNIKMNHSDDVTDNVAKVTNTLIEGNDLLYEADIFNTAKHPDTVEMIEKGLVQHVSIEAIAGEMVKEEEKLVARGLEFTGLAFVDTPGIAESSVALAEAFHKAFEKEENMKKEIIETLEDEKEEPEEPKEPESEEESPSESLRDKVVEGVLDEIKSLKEEIKSLKEKPKSKGIVTESKPKTMPLMFERTRKGKNFWMEEGLTVGEDKLY